MGICFFGCLPFYFSPWFLALTDAFFECVRLYDHGGDGAPTGWRSCPRRSSWRCFSHWLGGMGIVLLGLAILPLVGQGGISTAPSSPAPSRSSHRACSDQTKALWKIYILLTLLEIPRPLAGRHGWLRGRLPVIRHPEYRRIFHLHGEHRWVRQPADRTSSSSSCCWAA
jgi:Trk-type K+ transport system membrane component